jgi:hypothetical protein
MQCNKFGLKLQPMSNVPYQIWQGPLNSTSTNTWASCMTAVVLPNINVEYISTILPQPLLWCSQTLNVCQHDTTTSHENLPVLAKHAPIYIRSPSHATLLKIHRSFTFTSSRIMPRLMSYPIHLRFSSEVPDVRSDQIRSTDLYRIRHNKLLHSYPVHITLNTAYFLHLVYPPFWFIGYAFFRLCSTDPFHL